MSEEKSEEKVDDLLDRLGRFEVISVFMEENTRDVLRVMARCVVLRCEYSYHERVFKYVAYSPDFDPIPEGARAPEYAWQFDTVAGTLRAIRLSAGGSGGP